MKGIILAAGDGGRLRPLTLKTPKVLLDLAEQPLINYPLDALMSAGISDIAIVVGYMNGAVEEALKQSYPSLSYVYNDHYDDGGNAMSIYAARSFIGDDSFVVCMGDHAISPSIISTMLSQNYKGCVLCVDSMADHSSQIDDATRVSVGDDGYIANLGKEIEVWDCIDTGVFQMTSDVFAATEALMENKGVDVSITDMVLHSASMGNPFATCDVTGSFWADVDTIEDLHSVDRLLREINGRGI